MKYTYDLHIHSALSPCGEEEMTPNNIVNMAVVNGLDIIAVTDHNSGGNLEAISRCAEGRPLIFIPGIEVETVEEVHILCLFGTVKDALDMGKVLDANRTYVKNHPEIFGRQLLLDHMDRIVGQVEELLIFSTGLTVGEVFRLVDKREGCAIFAHVDREANSVFPLLGDLPKDLPAGVIEITDTKRGREFLAHHRELEKKMLLRSSDSHRLEIMNRGEATLEIPIDRREMTPRRFVNWLRKKQEE